jgi:hypothetical protein
LVVMSDRGKYRNQVGHSMFKFGISRKEQLTPDNLGSHHEMKFNIRHLYGFFKSRKVIALDLYNSLDDLSPVDRDKIQGRMLARCSLDNGSLKYTHNQRFNDFDQLALKVITTHFKGRLRLHDIARQMGAPPAIFMNTWISSIETGLSFWRQTTRHFCTCLERDVARNGLLSMSRTTFCKSLRLRSCSLWSVLKV